MAVRIVYILDNKTPDVVREGKGWLFCSGTLRILGDRTDEGVVKILVEIREDYVLSVEHIKPEDDAKKALEGPVGADKAPEEALKLRKKGSAVRKCR